MKNKYDIQFTSQFKRDFKLAKKQHRNLDRLFKVIDVLADGKSTEIMLLRVITRAHANVTLNLIACSSMKFAKMCWSCFFTG